MNVLFVCSGNICRSAMAAELLRAEWARLGASPALEVGSGGTLGLEGYPASPEAVAALAEVGVDLRHHRSQGVDAATIAGADLIVVMTREHLRQLDDAFPAPQQSRWLLRSFERAAEPTAQGPDLSDPIGRPIDEYRVQIDVIRRCVGHLAQYLLRGR